jgi:hypothetical protein
MTRAHLILSMHEDAIQRAQDIWHASRHARIPGTNVGIDIPGSIALSAGATAVSRAVRRSQEKAMERRQERMALHKKTQLKDKDKKK